MRTEPTTFKPMTVSAESAIRWFRRRIVSATGANPVNGFDISPATSTRLLILQPTPFCNIDCDYCYLPDRDATMRMSMHTLRLAVQRLARRRFGR